MSITQLPIGVFDSGVGGLSLLHALTRELPHESFRYAADCGFAPYGEKDIHEIQSRCLQISRQLMGYGIKALVIACNTATAAAIDGLRQQLEIPVIGIEPGVKPAAQLSRSGVVGILATRSTLQSPRYGSLVDRFGRRVRVIAQVCDGLAQQVETGQLEASETRSMLKRYLQPIIDAAADHLALGCTHYPFLMPLINELAPMITVVDNSQAVARETRRRLFERDLLSVTSNTPANRVCFHASGDLQEAKHRLERYWPGVAELLVLE